VSTGGSTDAVPTEHLVLRSEGLAPRESATDRSSNWSRRRRSRRESRDDDTDNLISPDSPLQAGPNAVSAPNEASSTSQSRWAPSERVPRTNETLPTSTLHPHVRYRFFYLEWCPSDRGTRESIGTAGSRASSRRRVVGRSSGRVIERSSGRAVEWSGVVARSTSRIPDDRTLEPEPGPQHAAPSTVSFSVVGHSRRLSTASSSLVDTWPHSINGVKRGNPPPLPCHSLQPLPATCHHQGA
jgi:hypothetical protein